MEREEKKMVVGAHAEMRPSRNAEGQGKTQEHLRPRSEGGGGMMACSVSPSALNANGHAAAVALLPPLSRSHSVVGWV